jgi:tRNA modification GTPase
MEPLDDTIVAIASASGGAARGIVRLSGPQVLLAVTDCFRAVPCMNLAAISCPTAVPGELLLPGFAVGVPADLFLWLGTRSYNGQPVVEVHTIGSPPILEAVLLATCAAGARMAEPGEFTLRAFLAGRIDLPQAEAVLGVIDARGDAELKTALAQLAGGLSKPLGQLRSTLLDLLAHLEAGFDFADEDLPFIRPEELLAAIAESQAHIAALLAQVETRQAGPLQPRVVLLGRPNAGKSSLFNALVGRDGAIVSDMPGTTRDYLTATLDLDGLECQLIDTAGVESGLQPFYPATIEAAAQAATAKESEFAHVRVLCIDATKPTEPSEIDLVRSRQEGLLLVLTKVDLLPEASWLPNDCTILTSATTGAGLAELRYALRNALLQISHTQSDVVAGTAVRCRESLRLASESLRLAEQACRENLGEELIAAEIRVALDELGKVAGVFYTDDLLDRIFSKFCIGK